HPLLVLRDLPLRGDRALPLEPVEGGVERAGVDLQRVAGARPDDLRDAVAVLRPPGPRLEDEQVARPLEERDRVAVGLARLNHVDTLQGWVKTVYILHARRDAGGIARLRDAPPHPALYPRKRGERVSY